MANTERGELGNRIVERLDQLDDETLEQLDVRLADERFGWWLTTGQITTAAGQDEPKLLSRRQLLAGLLAGGAVLGSTNLATAWYAREQGEVAGWEVGANAAQAQAMVEAGQRLREMQAEIDALRGLVAHYEALESVDLDRAVALSMERLEASLAGLPDPIRLLVDGIDEVRGALDRFEATVPAIRQGIAHVDDTLDLLDQRLEALHQVLSDIMERAAPVADNLGELFNAVLGRIPFGVGERIELALAHLRQVMEAVPATVAAVRERLVRPLQSSWFADGSEGDVQAGLLTPIEIRILSPAEQLLADLKDFVDGAPREVAEPMQQALAERKAAQQALAEYK